jgi:hypothetical protein
MGKKVLNLQNRCRRDRPASRANSASVSMQVSKHVISVGAALWLLIVVTLWEVTSVLVVVWLWLFALLPWAGVGAFAGSAAHDFLHAN